MHCIIYKFIVKENATEQFLSGWLGLTKLIYQYEGSLGSRVHKVNDTEYLAYAQWPSKLIHDNAGSRIPAEEADIHRKNMKDACHKIETLFEMDVVADYLQVQTSK